MLETSAPQPPEESLASPNLMPGRKELGSRQKEIVELQFQEYVRSNEYDLKSDLRDHFRAGDTALPKGTLLHGTSFSPEQAASIARYGVVSGELFGITEDGETYYCADFFRVPEPTTIADYVDRISQNEPTNGRWQARTMESEYLPSHRSRGEVMGVIIDPTIPELSSLFETDAYRPGTDELFEGITKLPFDKHAPIAERLSAILIGVPHGAIAGVMVSDRLVANEEHIARLREIFEGKIPILSTKGDLVA